MMTMKKLLMLLALAAGAAAPAAAGAPQLVTNVTPTAISCSSQTIGTSPVDVSSNTTVVTSSQTMTVRVMNLDTVQDVTCDPASNVSATPGSNTYGDPIYHHSAGVEPNWLAWGISRFQLFYCVATAANVSIRVCIWR